MHQQLLSEIEPGDDVLTTSGIYGRVNSFDGDSLSLEVADDTYIKILRSSIAQKIVYGDPNVIENGTAAIPEKIEEAETEEASEDD